MKLTFIIGNFHGARMDATHGGFARQPTWRSAHIKLTAEQVSALRLGQVGTEYGKPVFEEIDRVFVDGEG